MKGQFSALASVHALAVTSDGVVWAGGEFVTEGPDERIQPRGLRRRQRRAHQLPPGPERVGLSALVASGPTVYAGGRLHAGRWACPGATSRRSGTSPARPARCCPSTATSTAPCTRSRWPATRCTSAAVQQRQRQPRRAQARPAQPGGRRLRPPASPGTGTRTPTRRRALAVAGDTVFAGGDFATVNRSTPRRGSRPSTRRTGRRAPGPRRPTRRCARSRSTGRRCSPVATSRT